MAEDGQAMRILDLTRHAVRAARAGAGGFDPREKAEVHRQLTFEVRPDRVQALRARPGALAAALHAVRLR
jgi:hypothetical protein